MKTFDIIFKRDSKSKFGKNDPDIQRTSVSAKNKTVAVNAVAAHQATNGYNIRILKTTSR
jgi:hypothetical protein